MKQRKKVAPLPVFLLVTIPLFIVSLFYIGLTESGGFNWLFLILYVACYAILVVCELLNSRYKKYEIYFRFIIYYLFFAFYVKFLYLATSFDDIKSFKMFESEVIYQVAGQVYGYALLFLFAFMLVLFMAKGLRLDTKRKRIRISNVKAFLFISVSLVLKIISHYYFMLGLPGVEPQNTIPGVSGILAFYSRLGLFFVCNIYLIHAYLSQNNQAQRLQAALFVVAYILIDLSIGVKFSLVYQATLLGCLLFVLWRRRVLNIKATMVALMSLIFVLAIYKYINYYRFAMLYGLSGMDAVSFAINNADAQSLSVFSEILNRITGVENLFAGIILGAQLPLPGIGALFSGEFADVFTESITGVADAVNAVGASQATALYLVSGDNVLGFIFGAILIHAVFGLLFNSLMKLGCRKILMFDEMDFSEVFAAIFMFYFLFGSGNYIFYIKEIVVVFVSMLLFCIFARKREITD